MPQTPPCSNRRSRKVARAVFVLAISRSFLALGLGSFLGEQQVHETVRDIVARDREERSNLCLIPSGVVANG